MEEDGRAQLSTGVVGGVKRQSLGSETKDRVAKREGLENRQQYTHSGAGGIASFSSTGFDTERPGDREVRAPMARGRSIAKRDGCFGRRGRSPGSAVNRS